MSTAHEIAVHEAGHVVVAGYHKLLRIESVGFDPVHGGGVTTYPPGQPADPISLFYRMCMAAGGVVAMEIAGFEPAGADDDIRTLALLAEAMKEAAPEWSHPDPETEARGILAQPWHWVQVVGIARGILRHGVLRGEAIHKASAELIHPDRVSEIAQVGLSEFAERWLFSER